MNKRHVKPTAQQLANRTYRKVVALERDIAVVRHGQTTLHARLDSFRVLADHCARLLKEKETLRRMIYPTAEEMRRRQVNDYMAAPVRPCAVFHMHRPNIRCGVCGHIDLDIPTLDQSLEKLSV